MKIEIAITSTELNALRRVVSLERREMDKNTSDEIMRDRITRRLIVARPIYALREKEKSGRCTVCGCTERDPCNPPCGWNDQTATLCTACASA